jgi:hypothetical protein
MNDRWFFAIMFVFFAAGAGYGFWSGEMPAKISSFSRTGQPTLFKIAAVFWLSMAAISLWAAFTAP